MKHTISRQTTRDTFLNTNIMERSLKLHKTLAGGIRSLWSQKQQKLEILSLSSYSVIFVSGILLSLFYHYLYIYCKGNSWVQMGSGHNQAKNSKNWRLYPYVILIIIFIHITKKTEGYRSAQVTQEPKTGRIGNFCLDLWSICDKEAAQATF